MEDNMSRCKRICGAGLVVAFTLVGLVATEQKAAAIKKPIIIKCRSPQDIEPIALVSPNGREVEITLGGPTVPVTPATKISALVLVYQESTGAIGLGLWTSPKLRGDVPDTDIFPVVVHALGRSRFGDGPATACYFAEERVRGKLVRDWSHCEEIELFEAP
jgi:hypothetical protein